MAWRTRRATVVVTIVGVLEKRIQSEDAKSLTVKQFMKVKSPFRPPWSCFDRTAGLVNRLPLSLSLSPVLPTLAPSTLKNMFRISSQRSLDNYEIDETNH
uniref:Uncharacterized protein n=1 Tax=Romanomermis culicivorax TaxID=13658 RepID=A0A915HXC0_ROMCU